MGRGTFDRLRVWAIHKLKGVIPEEIKLPETPPVKAYVAIPKKISARMILREGELYVPSIIQQMLSYQIADALVDNGFFNFTSAKDPAGFSPPELRAELWVVKKEERHNENTDWPT